MSADADVMSELQDPGLSEGMPVAPIQDASSNVINADEYKNNLRAAEKLNSKLINQLEEHKKLTDEMRAHNVELAKQFADARTADDNKNKNLDADNLKALRDKKTSALSNDDYKTAMQIQDDIDSLLYAAAIKPSQSENQINQTDIDKAIVENVNQKIMKEAVAEFVSSSPWAQSDSDAFDPVMYGAANAIDQLLAKDPEWSKKSIREQLGEVKRRVETRFEYGKSKANMPVVGGIGSGSNRPSNNEISPTAEQVRVAQNFFPGDPDAVKKYMEQVKMIQSRRS